jgi:hypothetical protein
MNRKTITLAAVLAAGIGAGSVTDAEAATWRSCPGSYAVTQVPRVGMYMESGNLRVRSPMNCASGRYALRTVRARFRTRRYLPERFSDGYVSWYGWIVSGRLNAPRGATVQYAENTSHTSFRFHAHIYSD